MKKLITAGICSILVIVAALFLALSTSEAQTGNSFEFDEVDSSSSGFAKFTLYRDFKTGCEYIRLQDTLIPRLNTDGQPRCLKQTKLPK